MKIEFKKEETMQVIKNLKKKGWKQFKKEWKQGIMRLTPEQLLRSEMIGYAGSILGTIAAGVILILWGMYPFIFIIAFNIVIQGSQLIGKYQQYNLIKTMKDQYENIQDLMEVKK